MNFGKLQTIIALAFIIAMPSKLHGAAQQNETKGVCSPIAPDNHGAITINCSGFSDKQYRVLRDFLEQLSGDQARQQDILLSKLNEILDSLRKQESQSKPRVIPDSDLQLIARANWGIIAPANIIVVAPSGDVEAENFAKQIAGALDRGGMNVRLAYEPLTRGARDPDLLIVQNNLNSYCMNYLLLGPSFARQIDVKYERVKPPSGLSDSAAIEKFESDPKLPLKLVVYPKK